MSTDTESRKFSNLRVIDLKSELEKRGLDKSGNKQALIERLQKALEDEGLDPETFEFVDENKSIKQPPSQSSNQQENITTPKETEESEDMLKNCEIIEEIGEVPEESDISKHSKNEEKLHEKAKLDGTEEKSKAIDDSKKWETSDKHHISSKDDSGLAEAESPIRLTLEEEETFQDEEIESVTDSTKSDVKINKQNEKDAKNSSNKNQDAAKDTPVNSEKAHQNKKQEGTGSPKSSKTKSLKAMRMSLNRNLWITNISQNTRAVELKDTLSPYGKVIGAKVVMNAKYPGTCCYGYVTMLTVEDANNCIAKLNNTELNGQIIRVEKVRPDHVFAARFNVKKPIDSNKDEKGKQKGAAMSQVLKFQDKETGKGFNKDVDKAKKEDKHDEKRGSKEDLTKDDSSGKNLDASRKSRSLEKSHHRSTSNSGSRGDVLTFDKIKEVRERQRQRERERYIREENRRRREEIARQREVERMQRSEAARLDREREKLRTEREKLEKEKAEIIRLERERQKVEREKLEIERLELQRAKLRLQEEDRRTVKRSAPYRREGSYEERKRVAGSERRYEESPTRFEPSSVKSHEPTSPTKKFGSTKPYNTRIVTYKKRDSYSSKRENKYETECAQPQSSSITRDLPTTITKYEGSSVFSIFCEKDLRDGSRHENSSISNSRMSKESRYNERERERSPHYRTVRLARDRRPIPEHKTELRSSREHRYTDPDKDSQRFDHSNTSNSWTHSSPSSNKMFSSSGSNVIPKTWRSAETSNNSDRWNTGNVSRGTSLSTTGFSGNSNMNMGPSCPPPPTINNYPSDRFEYKSISTVRKY